VNVQRLPFRVKAIDDLSWEVSSLAISLTFSTFSFAQSSRVDCSAVLSVLKHRLADTAVFCPLLSALDRFLCLAGRYPLLFGVLLHRRPCATDGGNCVEQLFPDCRAGLPPFYIGNDAPAPGEPLLSGCSTCILTRSVMRLTS